MNKKGRGCCIYMRQPPIFCTKGAEMSASADKKMQVEVLCTRDAIDILRQNCYH